MGKKRLFLLLALALAMISAILWLALPPSVADPIYRDKHLSQWLKGYSYDQSKDGMLDKAGADEAAHELGTNCIPTLLRMSDSEGSIFKLLIQHLAYNVHLSKAQPSDSLAELNYQACQGFRILGAEASNAVPALVRIYERKGSGRAADLRRMYAVEALGFIGPTATEAVPVLLESIRDPTSEHVSVFKAELIRALGKIHAQPATVVPLLLEALEDFRGVSIKALGNYGTNAYMAAPRLYEILKNDPSLYGELTNALMKIDPEAPEKLKHYPKPKEADDSAN